MNQTLEQIAKQTASMIGARGNAWQVIYAQFLLEKGDSYWAAYPNVAEYNFGNTHITQMVLTTPYAGMVAYAYTLLVGNPEAYHVYVDAMRVGNVQAALEALAQSPWSDPPYGNRLIETYDTVFATPVNHDPAVYTVERGNTVWGIATRFGIPIQTLLRLNPQIKDPNLIEVGETLRLY